MQNPQTTKRPVTQTTKRPVTQTTKQPDDQTTKQPNNQMTKQPKYPYDQLVEMFQNKEIGWKEFILYGDQAEEYETWCNENKMPQNDMTALQFLNEAETEVLQQI